MEEMDIKKEVIKAQNQDWDHINEIKCKSYKDLLSRFLISLSNKTDKCNNQHILYKHIIMGFFILVRLFDEEDIRKYIYSFYFTLYEEMIRYMTIYCYGCVSQHHIDFSIFDKTKIITDRIHFVSCSLCKNISYFDLNINCIEYCYDCNKVYCKQCLFIEDCYKCGRSFCKNHIIHSIRTCINCLHGKRIKKEICDKFLHKDHSYSQLYKCNTCKNFRCNDHIYNDTCFKCIREYCCENNFILDDVEIIKKVFFPALIDDEKLLEKINQLKKTRIIMEINFVYEAIMERNKKFEEFYKKNIYLINKC